MNALIIINERAGSHSPETVERAIREELQQFPPAIRDNMTILITSDPEIVQKTVASRHAELDRVIAAGGDGTITAVISAIIAYPHIHLGIIPVGTGNRLASNLGIPTHIKGALETALEGSLHRIDIGRINNRYFSLMAGAGLDADIMATVHPFEKKTMGIFAYFWKGVVRAFRTPYAVYDIEADGQRIRSRGIGVVVANAGNLLGPYFTLTPGAQPDDGLFDICVLGSRHRTDYWTAVIQVLSQQSRSVEIEDSGIRHLRARNITIRSRPRVRAQADGDVIGTTPVEIEALPQAIAVLVPPPHRQPNPLTTPIQNISDHLWLVIRDLFGI